MRKKDPRSVKISRTLKYLWQFYVPVKRIFFGSAIFSGISVLLGFFVVPIFLKEFFDLIFEFSGKNRTELLPDLLKIIWEILVINFLAFWVCARAAEFLLCRYVAKMMKHAEEFCFAKILEHSPEFFANHFVGSLVSKFGRFVRSVDGINMLFYFTFWPNALRFLAAIAVIFYFAPKIAIVLAFWIVVFLSVIFFSVKKWRLPRYLHAAETESKISGKNADAFANILPIKMFARQPFEREFFQHTVDVLFSARLDSWFIWAKINIFQSVMVSFLEIFSLYLMAQMWVAEQISVGTIIMIQGFLLQIYINLWTFGGNIQDFFRNMADAEEMIETLETPLGIADPKIPEKCKISKGEIEFKNASFRYSENIPVFENFNLKIEAGKRVGLVGESGAGKSTITKLLLRFIDLNSGKICIDGQNITEISQNDLREHIAFVPQEPILFHRSLFENIKYGNPNATNKEVYTAAKKAHAHEFILKTPEKYQTKVGERGVKLSGGEKQRIAIARAMLKNAPILILDEATSALDSRTEKIIQSAIDALMKDRTTIVIAHRLSTLRKMDEILVLENGKIIESGTHEALIQNKSGAYRELWNHQFLGQ